MDKATITRNWISFRCAHGIGLRAVAALPEDALDRHPIPGMRTPKELVVHLYAMTKAFPAAVRDGRMSEVDEKALLAGIRSKADLLAFCRQQFDHGDAIVGLLTDAQIAATVETPWGPHPGFVMMTILNDEFWHHRGQLYVFLRALGVEPAMLYDYEHNEAAFQPREQATT